MLSWLLHPVAWQCGLHAVLAGIVCARWCRYLHLMQCWIHVFGDSSPVFVSVHRLSSGFLVPWKHVEL
jgi:hypothetical protein